MSNEECQKLGASSRSEAKVEICAGYKNMEEVPYLVYSLADDEEGKSGGKFELEEKNTLTLTYFGGSDACQGDSGGPL